MEYIVNAVVGFNKQTKLQVMKEHIDFLVGQI